MVSQVKQVKLMQVMLANEKKTCSKAECPYRFHLTLIHNFSISFVNQPVSIGYTLSLKQNLSQLMLTHRI